VSEVHIPGKGLCLEKRADKLIAGDLIIFVSDRPPLIVLAVLARTRTEITYQVAPYRAGFDTAEIKSLTLPKKKRVAYSVALRGN
jgi:hypothetical protein